MAPLYMYFQGNSEYKYKLNAIDVYAFRLQALGPNLGVART